MHARAAFLSVALALAVVGAAPGALAHENHRHQRPQPALDEQKARVRAQEELERLVSAQKVDATWKASGKLKAVEKKGEGAQWEWLATFENSGASDASKRLLYVFLRPSGEFVAANFTGK
jgi:hypothetical protein